MNYSETIDYLYHKLPLFSRVGSAAFKKDLTNTRILCEYLGNPQQQFKSVHVGGTNGKGSVSHMLASVFQSSGYTTGLYTSPHLYDFRERIRVNGQVADEDYVISFVEKIKPVIEDIQPSFFEITVAMAFDYFAQKKVEMAIVEVGLGGRLDSTNIITPELSVITNIGWDHMNMLGNSLEEIAAEKAGIIKEGVPVVIGERKKETDPVFLDQSIKKNSSIAFAEDQYNLISQEWKNNHTIITVKKEGQGVRSFELDLPGVYQQKNLLTVLNALDILQKDGYQITEASIHEGLKNVRQLTGLMGRWEILRERPIVILEVAHNKDGMEQMLQHLKLLSFDKLHMVIGMVKDKDAAQVLSLLPSDARYYFTQAHIPRALPAEELKEKAANFSLTGKVYSDVNEALHEALHNISMDDLIIVCGSIFLVAEVNKDLILQNA
ncbi:bifunctional folylpolyglutamate synthase/dihydrofolate synthase [Flavisolibacter ginsengisoli]|uniref:Dihydrofolate synthase/folylpolyglutamate synthase n=1 Tax=Flavisolibacter ginsengisoli DSM 18119 TaxID=1121884 RepID=A0A1M5A9A1_9BACT|nr:folylpolyglutamate synthase/dihydrofolate synthase family protein [Flavisolibacter ginsengisoli]SHF26891.1 dihydrofolate synthase / folylpolyglutamate synthase [Flavisolibacter ginsengisoli DSM 18119]